MRVASLLTTQKRHRGLLFRFVLAGAVLFFFFSGGEHVRCQESSLCPWSPRSSFQGDHKSLFLSGRITSNFGKKGSEKLRLVLVESYIWEHSNCAVFIPASQLQSQLDAASFSLNLVSKP